MARSLAVGCGGVLGALSRFWLGTWLQGRCGGVFPWATLSINLSGCFALGILVSVVAGRVPPASQEPLQLALGVGFLGAYTTFSTFEFEALTLFRTGGAVMAAIYLGASLMLGLLAVWIGVIVGR